MDRPKLNPVLLLLLVVVTGCKKGDSPKPVKVGGTTAVDCVELYKNWDKPTKPQGNCAMRYFDAACAKTKHGIAGAETTSDPGGAGCNQVQLIVAQDYKAAREKFGYPQEAAEMSKRERKDRGYLPPDIKPDRNGLPPGLNAE